MRRIKTLKRKVSNSFLYNFIENVSTVALGTIIGRAIIFVLAPIITRLYTPNEFGVLAVYTSIIIISNSVISLGLTIAIQVPKSVDKARKILYLAIGWVLVNSSILGAILYIYKGAITEILNISQFSEYIWLIPLGLVFFGIYENLKYWAVRVEDYKLISITEISQSTSTALSQIAMGFSKIGYLGLIVGKVVGRVVGGIVLSRASLLELYDSIKLSIKDSVLILRKYKKFLYMTAPGQLFNTLGLRSPSILFAIVFSPEVAGYYALAERVMNAPVTLMATSVQKVFIGEFSKEYKKDTEESLQMYVQIPMVLSGIALLPCIGLFFMAPDLFAIIFGDEWKMSGSMVALLSPIIFARFVVAPVSQTLNIIEKQKRILFWEVIKFASFSGPFLLAIYYDWKALDTLLSLSVLGGISYLCIYLDGYSEIKKKMAK